jgi:type IV secretion system protein VirD4
LSSHVPIYLPPAFFWWSYAYDAYAAEVFVEGVCVAASGGTISIIVAFATSVVAGSGGGDGGHIWFCTLASQLAIRSAGLAGADGVILGRFEGLYLRHDEPEPMLCFAPTRSGIGVGLVVPTFLTWPGSAIVHDIKGEEWTLTSSFRAQHGRGCCLIQPTQGVQPTTLSWK